ncbi:MAG: CCA tRNA nucleotidyltransferase [Bacteroidales bacterium]|jgi:poly(A) polymerase|nr:CCA tRNA nucleotidyltransferase [Bacteroidales bacterium]
MDNCLDKIQHPIYALTGIIADELGVEAYAVGGVVRDVFLNRNSKDIDIVVVGSGIEVAKAVAEAISPSLKVNVYKTFGTASFPYQDIVVEFVGARKESYQADSRNPIVEDGTLQDDLNRRDFTINTLAIALNGTHKGKLIDVFHGVEDIKNKMIRTPLDPDITFSDDPLRMMRAVRFASQLNFTITPETLQSIKRNVNRLEIITIERVVEEFNKILLSSKPSIGINLLAETGLLKQFLPQVLSLKGIDYIEGKGHKDNYFHTLEVVDKIALVNNNLWLVWSALLHDIAKPATKRFDKQIGWTFYGHEVVGARMAETIFKRLKLPANEKLRYVKKLINLHLRPIALVEDHITDSAIRRLLFDAGDDIDDLMLLCDADITSKNPEKVRMFLRNFEKVREKLKEIEEKDKIRNWQPPVDGALIMETFGLTPSKPVGIIKTAIREAILDGKIENNYKAAYQLMLQEGEKLGLKQK